MMQHASKYPIVKECGQRIFGPPMDWTGPPPPRGCEVFVSQLPLQVFENELAHLFSCVGNIYQIRLMMSYSGLNRGYAFITYSTRIEAIRATNELNNFEIRFGQHIGVEKSMDNCRLFLGGVSVFKTREKIYEELSRHVSGITDVKVCESFRNPRLHRGYAFVEFSSHLAATLARRAMKRHVKRWGLAAGVEWADPEPENANEQMYLYKRVGVYTSQGYSNQHLSHVQ